MQQKAEEYCQNVVLSTFPEWKPAHAPMTFTPSCILTPPRSRFFTPNFPWWYLVLWIMTLPPLLPPRVDICLWQVLEV